MSTMYTIGVYLERYDEDGYVKPYFFNLPYSQEIKENSFIGFGISKPLIDSKYFGIMFNFFYALSKPNEKIMKLNIILTNKKEEHKDWIELHKKYKDCVEYEVHNLDNYKGERFIDDCGLGIDLKRFYHISNPEYIYLKHIPY
jgi:hypothetical protein